MTPRVCILVLEAIFPLLFPAMSCTVLEDRTDCPCRVEVDFSSVGAELLPIRLFAVSEGVCLSFLSIDNVSEPSVLELPRRGVKILAVSGEGWPPAGPFFGGIVIPQGEECPRVFFWRETVDTEKETVHLVPEFKKQYCTLTMNLPDGFNQMDFDDGGISFEYEGNVAGYDSDMNPLPGQFSFSPVLESSSGKCFSVCLPRQRDASLMLHVLRGGRQVCSFPVGAYMDKYGYDWASEDLPDMTLSLDFALWPILVFPEEGGPDVFHEVKI